MIPRRVLALFVVLYLPALRWMAEYEARLPEVVTDTWVYDDDEEDRP